MKVVVPQEPALRQRKKEQAQQNKTSNPNPPLMRMGMPVNGRQDFQPLTDSGSHPPAPRMMMPVWLIFLIIKIGISNHNVNDVL